VSETNSNGQTNPVTNSTNKVSTKCGTLSVLDKTNDPRKPVFKLPDLIDSSTRQPLSYKVTFDDALSSIMFYKSSIREIVTETSTVGSDKTPGLYPIRVDTTCHGQAFHFVHFVQLRAETSKEELTSDYGARMTKPDLNGRFDIIFNDTTVKGNHSMVDDKIMSISVRRDGELLKLGIDYSWKCMGFEKNTMTF